MAKKGKYAAKAKRDRKNRKRLQRVNPVLAVSQGRRTQGDVLRDWQGNCNCTICSKYLEYKSLLRNCSHPQSHAIQPIRQQPTEGLRSCSPGIPGRGSSFPVS